jgi:hypothetical protein
MEPRGAKAFRGSFLILRRSRAVHWLAGTDHLVLGLIKDPHNAALTREYMTWEKENAVRHIEEIWALKKDK